MIKGGVEIIEPELSYKITGILFRVHKKLGRFRNEQQYCDGIEEECKINHMHYDREFVVPPSFPGEEKRRNKIDFIFSNRVILEAKAKDFLTSDDFEQVKRYLVSTNIKLGLLVNFRKKFIDPKRVLNPNGFDKKSPNDQQNS